MTIGDWVFGEIPIGGSRIVSRAVEVSETATASDIQAGLRALNLVASESLSAADIEAALLALNPTILEAGSAADIQAGLRALNLTTNESGSAGESTDGSQGSGTFAGSTAETLFMTDAPAVTLSRVISPIVPSGSLRGLETVHFFGLRMKPRELMPAPVKLRGRKERPTRESIAARNKKAKLKKAA